MTIPITRNTSPTLNLTNRLPKLSARNRSRCPLCLWTQSERAGPLPFQCVDTGIKPPFASVTAALQAIPAPSSNCDGSTDQLNTRLAAAIPQNSAQVPSPGIRCHSSLAANSVTGANQMIIALGPSPPSCSMEAGAGVKLSAMWELILGVLALGVAGSGVVCWSSLVRAQERTARGTLW